jgi:hypothetical protein
MPFAFLVVIRYVIIFNVKLFWEILFVLLWIIHILVLRSFSVTHIEADFHVRVEDRVGVLWIHLEAWLQCLQCLCNGLEIWVSNFVRGRRFLCSPDRLWGPPILLFNRYRGYFSGVMRPEREINHSSLSVF